MWFRCYCFILIFVLVEGYISREYFKYKNLEGKDIVSPIRTSLIGWKNYIRTLTLNYVHEIEDFGLCNFFLLDYVQKISRRFFGFDVNGTIKYTNGFISTLKSVHLQDNLEMYTINELTVTSEVTSKLIFNDVMLYFDYSADLKQGDFSGTVGIPIETIEFKLKIENKYNENKIDGKVYDIFAKIPKFKRWYYEPSNKYTQVMDRDVKWTFFNDLQILANTTFKSLLNKVIQKHKYPEICFDCHDKMQINE